MHANAMGRIPNLCKFGVDQGYLALKSREWNVDAVVAGYPARLASHPSRALGTFCSTYDLQLSGHDRVEFF